MPYTERSRANLLREGIAGERISVIGNPILEVIRHYEDAVGRSGILARLGLEAQRYPLVTMHREENVDVEVRLRPLVLARCECSDEHGLPRRGQHAPPHARSDAPLRAGRRQHGRAVHRSLRPAGLHRPPRRARCVLSDSGTVQEECCIFGVPNVTIRDVTERPETVECGSNILSGTDADAIGRAVRVVLEQKPCRRVPPEYLVEDVSAATTKIVLGRHERAPEPRRPPERDDTRQAPASAA